MVNWQQISSFIIVAIALTFLVRNYIMHRKKGDGESDDHCDACSAAEAFKEKKNEIRYKAVHQIQK